MARNFYQEYRYTSGNNPNGENGRRLYSRVINKIEKLSNIKRICELGCGNGYFAGELAARGYEVVGVDGSESGVKEAQSAYGQTCRFVQSEIHSSLSGKVGSDFDLVVAIEVIEHLYQPSDLIEAAAAQLRPGGYLLLTTPYHGYLKNLILAVTNRMDSHFNPLGDGGHIKFFSVETLTRLITLQDFTEIQFEFFGRFPWIWKSMICLAKRHAEGVSKQ